METRRWINQSQPQTLVNATMLLYFNAVFAILLGFTFIALFRLIGAAGAYGIANDRKWGYYVAVGAVMIPLTLLLFGVITGALAMNLNFFISLLFQAVLAYLLLHKTSREYQRIWFK